MSCQSPYPALHRRATRAISYLMTDLTDASSTGPSDAPSAGQANAPRATERPRPFVKPAYWSDAPPPAPDAGKTSDEELSPTRYGDWVKDGIAIDF